MATQLNPDEIQSSTWQKVRAHIEARLTTHRKRLESLQLDERETNQLRARIKELRDLMQMQEPKQENEDAS